MNTLTIVWGFAFLPVFFAQLINVKETFRVALLALLLYLWPTWHQFVLSDTNSDTDYSLIPWGLSVIVVGVSYVSTQWSRLWVSFALLAFVYNVAGFEQYDIVGGWRALMYNGILLLSFVLARHLEPEADHIHTFYRFLVALICGLGLTQSIVLLDRDEPNRWNDRPFWAIGVSFAVALVHVLLNLRYRARHHTSLCDFYSNKYAPVSS